MTSNQLIQITHMPIPAELLPQLMMSGSDLTAIKFMSTCKYLYNYRHDITRPKLYDVVYANLVKPIGIPTNKFIGAELLTICTNAPLRLIREQSISLELMCKIYFANSFMFSAHWVQIKISELPHLFKNGFNRFIINKPCIRFAFDSVDGKRGTYFKLENNSKHKIGSYRVADRLNEGDNNYSYCKKWKFRGVHNKSSSSIQILDKLEPCVTEKEYVLIAYCSEYMYY